MRQPLVIRIAAVREGHPRRAHFVRERLAIRAVADHVGGFIHVIEHEGQLHAVHRAHFALMHRRIPVEVIHVHRSFGRGQLAFGDGVFGSAQRRQVGGENHPQVHVRRFGTAFAVDGDRVIRRSVVCFQSLFHAGAQLSIVEIVRRPIRIGLPFRSELIRHRFGFDRAQHDGDVRGNLRRRGIIRMLRQRAPIHHRREAQREIRTVRQRRQQSFRRKCPQLIAPDTRQQQFGRLRSFLLRQRAHRRIRQRAVNDGAMKQALGRGHGRQHGRLPAAAGLAEDGDVARHRRRTPRCCRAPIRAPAPDRAGPRCSRRRDTDSRTR